MEQISDKIRSRIKGRYTLLIIGSLVGALYGLVVRLVFGWEQLLASTTFLFLVPVVLGIVPLFFAWPEQLKSYRNTLFIPWLTLGTFFFLTIVFELEGLVCLLILGAPFILLGTLGAFIYSFFRIRKNKRKDQNLIFLLLAPFLLGQLEGLIDDPSVVYEVRNEIVIEAPPAKIWDQIVRVPTIEEEEYTPGLYNWMGIPRPIKAELFGDSLGAKRIGHFGQGLRFEEIITEWTPAKRVAFGIAVDKESLRDLVFDRHVLGGNYFTFLEAAYELDSLGPNQTRLVLSSDYQLTTKLNFYGKFWGDRMIADFQERLLWVIRDRCEDEVQTLNQ